MQTSSARRWALGGGVAVLAALCWIAPPWAVGDADSVDSAAAVQQVGAAADASTDASAAPSVPSAAGADAAVALADGQAIPDANLISGEQKILATTTRPASGDLAGGGAGGNAAAGGSVPVGPSMGGGAWRPPRSLREPVSAAEWADVGVFMSRYSPIRESVIESLPDSPRRNAMIASAVRDYRAYQRASNDPKIAALIQSRVKLGDDIFDLARQLRQADAATTNSLKDRLRQKVAELFDENIKERQVYLDRLKATVANQQAMLAHDTSHRSEVIDQRLADILRGAQRWNSWLAASGGAGGASHGGEQHPGATTQPR